MNHKKTKAFFLFLLFLVSITPHVYSQELTGDYEQKAQSFAADSEPPTCDIIFTPDSISLEPEDISPVFGPAVRTFTTEYKDFGVVFGSIPGENVPVAVFNDPPNAWGGVNLEGRVDLYTSVVGSIVYPGTTEPATTSFLRVEAGFAGVGNLLLEVFDSQGSLIASTINDDGYGTHGRTLMVIFASNIRYFRISSYNDDFGVNEIQICSPKPIRSPVGGMLLDPNYLGVLTTLASLLMAVSSILSCIIMIGRYGGFQKRH